MFLAFPVLILIVVALTIPAWSYARRRDRGSHWLLILWLPAVILWIVLSGLGVGAQSLSNLIEVFWLMAAGIVLSYLKVFIVDRHIASRQGITPALMAALALAALLLRLFMPILPE